MICLYNILMITEKKKKNKKNHTASVNNFALGRKGDLEEHLK